MKFLGVVIKPHRIYIANRTKGNFYEAIEKQNKIARNHKPTKNEQGKFLSSMNSYLGIMKHYNTYGLRKMILFKNLSGWWWNWTYLSGGMAKFVLKQKSMKNRNSDKGILGDSYCPQVSENSLILLLKWRELSPQSYPLPRRFCLSGAELSGFVFDSLPLQNVLFDRASLQGARFINCDLSNSNFQGAKMPEVRFANVLFHSANAKDSNAVGSIWEDVTAEELSLCGADLTSAIFLSSRLMKADFSSANLRFAAFTQTDLTGALFSSSLLDQTGLLKCTLKDVSPGEFKDSVVILPKDSPITPSYQINELMPRILKGHENSVYSVAISAEAGVIVSGSADKTIKLWELKAVETGGSTSGRLVPVRPGDELTIYSLPEGEWAGLKGKEFISGNAYKYAGIGINLTTFPARAVSVPAQQFVTL